VHGHLLCSFRNEADIRPLGIKASDSLGKMIVKGSVAGAHAKPLVGASLRLAVHEHEPVGLNRALKGAPGTREFADSYDAFMVKHAPEVLRLARPRGEQGRGTIGWAIRAFMTDTRTSPWATCSESTRDVYRRHFDWLRENLGDVMLNAVDEDAVRAIRDKRKAHPSVANMTVAKLGQVWDWAKEFGNLTGEAKLIGRSPTRDVADLKYDSQSAPAWPPQLCAKFEAYRHPRMVTFYMLGRYTGHRRGDCCAMKWADFERPAGALRARDSARVFSISVSTT
jgi:hypothetical protein